MKQAPTVPDKRRRPKHVAVIMDGNGRWAADRGLPRLEGHRRGADVVREITTYARELEIEYLTLYSFSAQNWRRPPLEVAGLMTLLHDYCVSELPTLMKNGIRLSIIGDLGRFPPRTRTAVQDTMDATHRNRHMTLTLALDYGGREELVKAARLLAADVKAGRIAPDAIDEKLLASRLDTSDMPDPDLVIRTSGEKRVSNFLLWQLAYSELHFTDVRWPDFSREDFARALVEYAGRDRRFGAVTSESVVGESEVGSSVVGASVIASSGAIASAVGGSVVLLTRAKG
jgi:undecaprenyl diphosphate synthase